jgi:hypothetical protein
VSKLTVITIAESQLLNIKLNDSIALSILEMIMDNNKPDIVRMAGAAYLKTTLSKIYNVRAGSCNSL